ncbi:hypothetical protein D3C80_1980630 [compost metagenome]
MRNGFHRNAVSFDFYVAKIIGFRACGNDQIIKGKFANVGYDFIVFGIDFIDMAQTEIKIFVFVNYFSDGICDRTRF